MDRKREGWRTGQDVGAGLMVLGIENHYSPTYERCYVLFNYLNKDTKSINNGLPRLYYELWDAFEEKLLSMCTDELIDARLIFCTIPVQDKQQFMNCTVCQGFVKDRMTK